MSPDRDDQDPDFRIYAEGDPLGGDLDGGDAWEEVATRAPVRGFRARRRRRTATRFALAVAVGGAVGLVAVSGLRLVLRAMEHAVRRPGFADAAAPAAGGASTPRKSTGARAVHHTAGGALSGTAAAARAAHRPRRLAQAQSGTRVPAASAPTVPAPITPSQAVALPAATAAAVEFGFER